jgi:hypothetical protein
MAGVEIFVKADLINQKLEDHILNAFSDLI